MSVPAAAAAGIEDVTFDKDVVLYVENFTGSPVGKMVPLGHYDRTQAAWRAEKSGRIIKIISETAGLADLDVNGDGLSNAADLTEMTALGIDSAERAAIAAEYAPPQQLWRSAVRHFSAWDCNWGIGLPPLAVAPPPPSPVDDTPPDPCERAGSIIGCESRTLGEELPIVGTPYKLRYQSERSAGFQSRVTIRVSDDTDLPLPPRRAHIQVDIAGRHFEYVKSPVAKNDTFTFFWDGVDAYGRQVGAGTYEAKVRVGFEYGAVTRDTQSFADFPGAVITGDRAARLLTVWREASIPVTRMEAKPLGFGGWTLDANHVLDTSDTPALFLGSGERRRIGIAHDQLNYVIESIAGGGAFPNHNDNGLATQAYLGNIEDVSRGPDGSLYLAVEAYASASGRVRRVGPDGVITTLAGQTPVVAKVDGGPALNADVHPIAVAAAPDGSIVFADNQGHRVWRIVPGSTPTLRLVAGSGAAPGISCPAPANCGDGGDARTAELNNIRDIAVASDGTIFIADSGHNRVRRVGPEGNIATYYSGSSAPVSLSLRPDGVCFVRLSSDWLVRVEPTGTVTTVLDVDGTPANLQLDWCGPGHVHSFSGDLVALPDDSFVISCATKVVLRAPTGRLIRIAGPEPYNPGAPTFAGDGGPALRARFGTVSAIAMGERNEIILADRYEHRIRRMRGPGPTPGAATATRAPSADGHEIYEFDVSGKHLRTLNAQQGTVLASFAYDPSTGQLASITDVAGNTTTIARTAGQVTITAPHGQVTTLALDASGYLASVTNPVSTEVTQLAYSLSGLLTDLADPRGHTHHFEYAPDGRLTRDVDATPGSLGTRLTTTADAAGWTVEITSPEGRVVRHRVDREGSFGDSSFLERRTITSGSNLATIASTSVDNAVTSSRPDGTKVSVLSMAPDPRWGVMASFASATKTEVGPPGGAPTHSMTISETRSATLATAGDPFSVTGQTITTTRAGNGGLPASTTTTRVFTAGPPAKWTTTTGPNGLSIEETLDSLERVVETKILGSSPVTLEPVHYQYDVRGRIDQVTWGTRVYGTAFNATTGWAASTSAPAGMGVTYTSRDDSGRPLLMMLPGSRSVAMSYDLSGNMVSVTPPGQPSHGFSFDPSDRLASYVPPDVTPSLSPKDTPYGRDRDGLLLFANHPGKPVTYAYDLLGRLTRRVDAVTTNRAYDAQGRLSSIATSDGVTLTNTYVGSLLTTQTVSGPFARALNKTYDNFLRVSSWNFDGVSPIAITYDGADRVTSSGGMTVTRSTNGLLTGTSVGSVSDAFSFNPYGEVIGHTVSGAAVGFTVATTRDAAGRIDLRTETIAGVTHSFQYVYDTAGRLAEVYDDGAVIPSRSWTYDANGNRDDGTYDAQDRLTSMNGATFTYGNNGELATKTAAGATTTYGYDAHGNLRTVARPAPLAAISYVIDGQNRRIGKKVGGTLVQGFVYDGSRIVAELASNGAEVARFVYTTGGHSPDVVIKGGVTYRVVKDHLGSPRMVANSSTGAVVQRINYNEWGAATVLADTTPAVQPFGFAGGLWDRETGLMRFGARDYDAVVARWTSKDTWRFGGGDSNVYAYVANDPINATDSTGHRRDPCDPNDSSCTGAFSPAPTPSDPPPYDGAGGFCGAFPQLCGGAPPPPAGGPAGGGSPPPGSPSGGDQCTPTPDFCKELLAETMPACIAISMEEKGRFAMNWIRIRKCVRDVMKQYGCSY